MTIKIDPASFRDRYRDKEPGIHVQYHSLTNRSHVTRKLKQLGLIGKKVRGTPWWLVYVEGCEKPVGSARHDIFKSSIFTGRPHGLLTIFGPADPRTTRRARPRSAQRVTISRPRHQWDEILNKLGRPRREGETVNLALHCAMGGENQ